MVGELSNTKYVLNIKTVQAGAFRILIEALKEILTDTNLIIDETGIKLVATDNSSNVLIHLKLDAVNFEEYYCPEKVSIGLNMNNLFKLIKTMNNNDTLTLFMEQEDKNRLGIQITNDEKNTQTIFKMNLLDIESNEINIPPATFETELTMPSGDFQKIIRDMTNIGDKVEIQSSDNSLLLKCRGDYAQQETVLSETENENGLQYKESGKNTLIQGLFSLKYLVLFTKCTNLCNLINLYIKNDYPLIIKYTVANLGSIKLCLAPIIED